MKLDQVINQGNREGRKDLGGGRILYRTERRPSVFMGFAAAEAPKAPESRHKKEAFYRFDLAEAESPAPPNQSTVSQNTAPPPGTLCLSR